MKRSTHLPTIAAILLLLTACNGEIAPGHTQKSEVTIDGLSFATVQSTQVSGQDLLTGTIESGDRAELAAQINGRVGKITVREGDLVKEGALLLSIEESAAGERLAAAEGGERGAAARLTLAEKTLERYTELRAVGAISQQEFDRAATEREAARQEFAALKAQADQARTSLGYTRVVAPYAGRVARRSVEVGSTVLPGTPLLTIDRDGDWHARLNVPESWLGRLAIGETMTLEIPSLGRSTTGTIREIIPATDPRSRSFSAKIGLPGTAGLANGLFVRAARELPGVAALTVPSKAVVERGQLNGVYVVADGRLLYRMVTTGRPLGDRIEILSGLHSGEKVVTGGVERAVSGAKVRE